MPEPSEAYRRFIASMVIDYDKWHDGEGYDLDALAKLEGKERRDVEALLLRRAGEDWRDKEALAALGSDQAIAAIEKQFKDGRTLKSRVEAAAELLELGKGVDAAPLLSDALRVGGDFSLFSRTLDLIGWHKVIGTLPALLAVAREGPGEKAVNAAAMVCYLKGVTDDPFDWEMRPFFLKFSENGEERKQAYRELCEKIGEAV